MTRDLRVFARMTVLTESINVFSHARSVVGSHEKFEGLGSLGVFCCESVMMFLNQVEFQGHEIRDVDSILIS